MLPTSPDPSDRSQRVCVVGAGSSGLAAARNLLREGFEVDVLEREDDLGGNWNYGKPNARVYRSTHMISSKPFTQFPDFPMPAHFPDYPHHTQVLEYLRDYARHHGVDRRIEYGAEVQWMEPVADGQGWRVTVNGERRRYAAVVIANGHLWHPRLPDFPGHFSGRILHSADYRTPEPLAGRRVLVVGGGNTGCDIVVEAAQIAARAFHSTRRGYHYMPKYLFGRPADQVGDLLLRWGVPLPVRRAIARVVLRLHLGRPEDRGLPAPDHRLFESHPVVNSLLPYYVRHGAIVPKPDVALLDGDHVVFGDGSREQVDVIVYATGYQIVFPFIEPARLNWRDGRPHLFRHVFHPHDDTLFVAGMIQPDSGQFGLVHWQTLAIARFLRAVRQGAPAADWLRARRVAVDESLSGGLRYTGSTRHLLEVEHWSYLKGLQRLVREMDRRMPPRAATGGGR